MNYFNCHTHLSLKPRELLSSFQDEVDCYQSFGFAPQEIVYWQENYIPKLSPKVIAIGESGLDRSLNSSWQQQVIVFRWHIKLAQDKNLPLIVHCVRAYDEVLSELRRADFSLPVIFHGYNGNCQQTERLLREANIYFSFGKLLLRNSKARQSLVLIPTIRIFMETDLVNGDDEAIDIGNIYEEAAYLRQQRLEQLVQDINLNVKNIWGDIFDVDRTNG